MLLLALASGTLAGAELYEDASQPVDARVADLLKRMSLEQKVEQLIQKSAKDIVITNGAVDAGSLQALFQGRSVGALCVKFGDDLFQSADRLMAAQQYLRRRTPWGIPALTINEGLHGVLARGATIYPQFLALGCTWNPELAREMGTQIAEEASAAGINQLLTPMVEVIRDPRWGRVEECIGESPFLVGQLCTAYTVGIQGDLRAKPLATNKCLAMLKTFAGYSAPANGINIAPCILGQRELRSVYFPPLQQIIRETGVLALMPSYNEVDGIPSHASHWLLETVLRGEWGFRGYTYSDWGGISMNYSLHRVADGPPRAAILAITAGVDVEAPSPDCYQHLPALVRNKTLAESQVDKAAARVLRAKILAGLFDGRPDAQLAQLRRTAHSREHVALSQRVAAESLVLLKNEGALLPLNLTRIRTLAVIGPNADQVQFGDYCWSKNNRDGVTILQGLRERLGNRTSLRYAKGCDLLGGSRAGLNEAINAVRESDAAVVVLGDTSMILSGVGWEDSTLPAFGTVGEGFDVTDPAPPGPQQELLRAVLSTGKPTVCIFLSGRPYCAAWIKREVPAIVQAFYPGEHQGYAVADVLLGNVNPSGSLPVTIPQTAGHIPTTHDYKPSGRGFYHMPGSPDKPGRDYVFSSPDPLWPFGYGLSYSTFAFSELRVETPEITPGQSAKITFSIRNTGARAGAAVPQVYLRDEVSAVTTPNRRLVGFQKLFLEPGETRRVTITIPASEMTLWNPEMSCVVEPGTFKVMVGRCADETLLENTFLVKAQ